MNNKFTKFLHGVKNEYFILSILLVLSFAVRLYKINSPLADWHSWRQVDTAAVTRIYKVEGIDLLYPKYYDISTVQTGYLNIEGFRFVEFPIYNLGHLFVDKLIGSASILNLNFEVTGRLTSIFASLITLFCVYYIGKKAMNKWVGLLSALFFALLPFNIYYSRVILPEPWATCFALISIAFFVKFLESKKYIFSYVSAFSFAASILIKPYAGFYVLAIFYLIYKNFGLLGFFKNKHIRLWFGIALLPFLAWRAWILEKFVGVPHFAWVFNGDGIRFRPSFWRWIFVERLGNLILGIWGIFLFLTGIVNSSKNKLFDSMILGMFLYVSVVATASVRHDYYQSIAIPAICLILGRGFYQLWNAKNNKLRKKIFAIFSTVLMLGASFYQVREYFKVNHPEFVEAGNVVSTMTEPDSLVVAPDNGNTVFLYYTQRRGWPVLEEDIEDVIKKGADYFVSVNKNDADTTKFREKFETLIEADRFIVLDLNKRKK